jgi:hypothetical protein
MSRILLCLSYVPSNAANGRKTIQEFGNYFRRHPHSQYEISLGVETLADQRPQLAQFGHLFPTIYVWDEDASDLVLTTLEGRRWPFYRGFSYGGFVNRVMILSRLASCDYLLRVDPGTLPPVDLWSMIETQVAALKSNRVVSCVYEDRLAFRDNLYARRSARDEYLAFIAQETGVDLHDQITGGALFMVASPGIPAIPFREWSTGNPTLVWASDDAIFQVSGVKARVFTELKVPRHDPFGKAKPPVEYFRGVVGMVYLNHLRRSQVARTSVLRFIEMLNNFLDSSLNENRDDRGQALVPLNAHEVAPPEFLDSIDSGYENYRELLPDWNDVVDVVMRAVPLDALVLRKS